MSTPSRMFGILGTGGGGGGAPAELDTTYTKTLLDNTTAQVLTIDPALRSGAWIFYSVVRGTDVKSGLIILDSNGTDTNLTEFGVNEVGSTGVTFTPDSTGGQMILNYTTTSTGADATMKYRMIQMAL
jgi:hypothetical protein